MPLLAACAVAPAAPHPPQPNEPQVSVCKPHCSVPRQPHTPEWLMLDEPTNHRELLALASLQKLPAKQAAKAAIRLDGSPPRLGAAMLTRS